jgi:hypothetical protein
MDQREAVRRLCDILSGRQMPEAGLDGLSSADREGLVDWALRLKVGGLLYRELKSHDVSGELIPPDAGNKLRDAYRSVAIQNTSLYFEGLRVLQSLAKDRLPAMSNKGLAQDNRIYGDNGLRPMTDLHLF